MTRDVDARDIAQRGLLRRAIEQQDWKAAANLARQAEAVQPGATWLRQERARLAVRAGNWADALTLADPNMPKAALATMMQTPRPPCSAAPRSVTMSPNMLLVTMTSRVSGLSTICMVRASTNMWRVWICG